MDKAHAEMEIKPQLKPRGSVGKEEDPKPSNQVYKLQIKSTLSNRKTVSIDSSYKKKETNNNNKRKGTSSDTRGYWRQEHTEVEPD